MLWLWSWWNASDQNEQITCHHCPTSGSLDSDSTCCSSSRLWKLDFQMKWNGPWSNSRVPIRHFWGAVVEEKEKIWAHVLDPSVSAASCSSVHSSFPNSCIFLAGIKSQTVVILALLLHIFSIFPHPSFVLPLNFPFLYLDATFLNQHYLLLHDHLDVNPLHNHS